MLTCVLWALGCFHRLTMDSMVSEIDARSVISTQTFLMVLTTSVDSCTEIKSAL